DEGRASIDPIAQRAVPALAGGDLVVDPYVEPLLAQVGHERGDVIPVAPAVADEDLPTGHPGILPDGARRRVRPPTGGGRDPDHGLACGAMPTHRSRSLRFATASVAVAILAGVVPASAAYAGPTTIRSDVRFDINIDVRNDNTCHSVFLVEAIAS